MSNIRMTAVGSSVALLDHHDLTMTLLGLGENDFWHIVELRLNLLSSQPPLPQQDNKITVMEHIEYLTEACLTEDLFIQLATTKQIISYNGRTITLYKYYHQAFTLRTWIPIAKPIPEFVVSISDLSARVVAELKVLDDPQIVLKQAVGRIFENIDSGQYHLSIARKLKVRLDK